MTVMKYVIINAASIPFQAFSKEKCYFPFYIVKPSTRLSNFILSIIFIKYLVSFIKLNLQFKKIKVKGRECNFKKAYYFNNN